MYGVQVSAVVVGVVQERGDGLDGPRMQPGPRGEGMERLRVRVSASRCVVSGDAGPMGVVSCSSGGD